MDIYNPNQNVYYVYLYLRPDYTPYYVGKGKGNRIHSKQHSINLPIPERRIIIQDNLTELQSFILERYYIRWFGRKDNNTGILRNRTNGGEGIDSEILRESNLNRIKNGTHNWLGPDTNRKRIENGTHQFLTITKDRIENGTHPSCYQFGKSHPLYDNVLYTFKHKSGEVYIGNRYEFYTKYNLPPQNVYNVIKRKRKSVMGWVLITDPVDMADSNSRY